jgi:acyl-CoA dehydrogenase
MSSALRAFRRSLITAPIFGWARHVIPGISATESEAIEAGSVWWDGDLFSGNPEFDKLLRIPIAQLSAEERAFMDGPVETLCGMIDDWQVQSEFDLPPDVWAYIKEKRFLGMIIPQKYGGLGFSATCHSEVIRKLSTSSLTASVTVMVPNSLGPGELLMQFGSEEQKQFYLPRLADGREIPCFGLTSADAGSDASAMRDHGIVCWGEWKGERVLGLRLNWSKRYITLCPVATLIGLAVKVFDPDHLLGNVEELGITVVLVPADTPGVTRGRRHYPAHQVFQNGPTQGKDVFLPLGQIIGGREQIGKGWKMLMSALAAGRGISLPSLSAGGIAFCAHATGAYARVRKQFGLPISAFEGVEAPLARIAGLAYLVDAARRLTCTAIDLHEHPAVVTAIMKYHATERLRIAINDAMDIHGGKAVMEGPHNYLGSVYRAVPVAITVEGANIMTRNLMIFGQGAIRCHPYLLAEMQALADDNRRRGLDAFDRAFWGHVGHAFANTGRALWRSWMRAGKTPHSCAPEVRAYYRQLTRYSSVLAFLSDMSLLVLGGALKRKELVSARLGDILAELYLLSSVLKRYEDEGRQEADKPLVEWCMAEGLKTMEHAVDSTLHNFPSRFVASLMRFVIRADAKNRRGISDAVTLACARLISRSTETRERLTPDLFHGRQGSSVAILENAFRLVQEAEPIERRLREAKISDWRRPAAASVLSSSEKTLLEETEQAVQATLMVDDFTPEELAGSQPKTQHQDDWVHAPNRISH